MNKKFYLFLAFPLFFLSFIIQDENLILWNAQRPLDFNDFNTKQNDIVNIENSGKFKFAESHFRYRIETTEATFSVTPSIEISVYFDSNLSWMLIKDENTLEHEQIHFNITELYARKMRKSVDSLAKLNVYDIEIYNKSIKSWKEKNNNYQKKFDEKIDDRIYYRKGRVVPRSKNRQQTIWKDEIDRELLELDRFKLQ